MQSSIDSQILSIESLISVVVRRDHVPSTVERSEDYCSKYDYSTVFFDVFEMGDKIRITAPPLLNFEEILRIGSDLAPITELRDFQVTITAHPRVSRIDVSLELLDEDGCLQVQIGEEPVRKISPSKNISKLLTGRRVVHTTQKDNALEWISDWVHFYRRSHDINTFVIYDNGSESYTNEELLDVMRKSAGSDAICIVVPWNFPFGPNMSPWDSNFTQLGAYDHSRFRLYAEVDVGCVQ